MALNKKSLGALYNKADVNRYQGDSENHGGVTKDDYMNAGPGSYIVAVEKLKLHESENEKSFGLTALIAELRIVSADTLRWNNKDHEPHYAPGDRVTIMHFLNGRGRTPQKEALEIVAAIVGVPPAVEVMDGEHVGEILPMIDQETINMVTEDDGAVAQGTQFAIAMAPNPAKDGSRIFYNQRLVYPCDEESGQPVKWPDWAALSADPDIGLDNLIIEWFGSR